MNPLSPSLAVRPVVRPEPADASVARRARGLLAEVIARARNHDFGRSAPLVLDFLPLAPEVEDFVNETLGEGEVSAVVRIPSLRIQETAFPGFWCILEQDASGRIVRDALEIGPAPGAIADSALTGSRALLVQRPPEAPLMNGPSIVAELIDAAARFEAGAETHVVNLTMLPVSPQDLQWIHDTLGVGTVSMLARGYYNCRITSTTLRHAWWVQYFNGMDQLILNTIEVTRVPEAALASVEDFEDSRERLAERVAELE
jgi:hydrogenase-1 operon protein HyaF